MMLPNDCVGACKKRAALRRADWDFAQALAAARADGSAQAPRTEHSIAHSACSGDPPRHPRGASAQGLRDRC